MNNYSNTKCRKIRAYSSGPNRRDCTSGKDCFLALRYERSPRKKSELKLGVRAFSFCNSSQVIFDSKLRYILSVPNCHKEFHLETFRNRNIFKPLSYMGTVRTSIAKEIGELLPTYLTDWSKLDLWLRAMTNSPALARIQQHRHADDLPDNVNAGLRLEYYRWLL